MTHDGIPKRAPDTFNNEAKVNCLLALLVGFLCGVFLTVSVESLSSYYRVNPTLAQYDKDCQDDAQFITAICVEQPHTAADFQTHAKSYDDLVKWLAQIGSLKPTDAEMLIKQNNDRPREYRIGSTPVNDIAPKLTWPAKVTADATASETEAARRLGIAK